MKLERALLLLIPLLFLSAPARATQPAGSAAELLHLLDYIGVDYPATVRRGKVIDADEYKEQIEFSQRAADLVAGLPAGAERYPLQRQAGELHALIRDKADGERIAAITTAMQGRVIDLTGIATVPRRAPSVAQGQRLFQAQCSGCHGAQGHGDGPLAAGLSPPPIDFSDRARQDKRDLYGLYNTIGRGVADTAMRGYGELSEGGRWALAFYTATLPFSAAEVAAGRQVYESGRRQDLVADLADLTRLTPEQARAQAGEEGVALVAYLRANPDALVGGTAALGQARRILRRSLDGYLRNDTEEAYGLAVSAYLDGFETAEAGLRNLDGELVGQVERAMSRYRGLVRDDAGKAEVQGAYEQADRLLARGQELLASTSLSPSMTFVSAMVILLREGLEALLVLAAIITLLIKAGRREALPWVHLGWIGALALGGVTWWVSEHVVAISGASRELTEGITALLATAVLLYVGFWLHSKTHARQWQHFLKEKIQGALHGKALWALAGVAFLAVYREVFETVLFFQALSQQADPVQGDKMLWAGLLAGAALLGVLAWVILRTSLRLPLRLFFNLNAALLFVLAVVFTGRGIAALQEAGVFATVQLNLPEFDWLGFYPTVQTVLGQLAIIALIGGLFIREWVRNHRVAA